VCVFVYKHSLIFFFVNDYIKLNAQDTDGKIWNTFLEYQNMKTDINSYFI